MGGMYTNEYGIGGNSTGKTKSATKHIEIYLYFILIDINHARRAIIFSAS